MNFKTYFSLALLLFGSFLTSKASHFTGMEMQYVCSGPCNILLTAKYYYDCSAGSMIFVGPSDPVGTTQNCDTLPLISSSSIFITDVTPICPLSTTACSTPGSVINGVAIWEVVNEYSYCNAPPNCTWLVNWTGCCRNGAITSGAANAFYGIQSLTINNGPSPCNNSPQFPLPSELYFCQGQAASFTAAAVDPDGDSLAYSLGPCLGFNYQFPYSTSAPLGLSWNVTIDAETGNITFAPQPGNIVVSVLCVYIEEWRNGQLINTSVRDWQVTLIPCPTNQQPQFAAYSNVSPNVVQNGDVFYTQPGMLTCFDIGATDANGLSQTLKLFWDAGVPGASFTDANNPSVMDTVTGGINPTGRFCFTPSAPGIYRFFVRAEDDACPILGRATKNIIVDVRFPASSASATPQGCNSANFTAMAGAGVSNATFTWAGQGGLSSNSPSFSHLYPGPGSYNWQVIISNGSTLNDTLTGTVTVVTSLTYQTLISPPGASFICAGQSFSFNGQSGFSSYLWSTGATTASISPAVTGNYGLTVTDNQGCQFFDSAQVFVQAPVYAPLISGNPVISPCTNGFALLSVPATFASYNWSNGVTTNSISTNTPGFYAVTMTDAAGCQTLDSVTVTSVGLDVSGTITTSNSGALIQQRVWLIELDTAARTLYAVDSTFTDNLGGYQFCGVTSDLFQIKAAPDSAAYPMELPTYATQGATWMVGNVYFLSGLPYQVNFSTLFGPNPGGPGFTGGAISMGAGRLQLLTDITPAAADVQFQFSPNPFREACQVRLSLPEPGPVLLRIYDARGQTMPFHVERDLAAGEFLWSVGEDFPAGVYFIEVLTPSLRKTSRIIKTR